MGFIKPLKLSRVNQKYTISLALSLARTVKIKYPLNTSHQNFVLLKNNVPATKIFILKRARGLIAGKRHIQPVANPAAAGKGHIQQVANMIVK